MKHSKNDKDTAQASRSKHRLSMMIHWDADGKCRQLVRPTAAFEGTLRDLAHAITGGQHHRIEVIDGDQAN